MLLSWNGSQQWDWWEQLIKVDTQRCVTGNYQWLMRTTDRSRYPALCYRELSMIKNSIVFRKCGSDAWWETNCVLRCWVRSRTERTSIHGNTARTPIFSGKAWHWLNLMQKNWIRKNTRKYGFNFDKGLIDQMMFTSTSDHFSHIEVLVKIFTI